jgi:hypothetical protein
VLSVGYADLPLYLLIVGVVALVVMFAYVGWSVWKEHRRGSK